jgi:integrase
MQEFSEILQRAEGLLAERPLRTILTDQEIARLADWHYAIVLSTDEAFTVEGAAEEEALVRSIAEQLTEADIEYTAPIPLDPRAPDYGLSNRQLIKRADHLDDWLPLMKVALSRGDVSVVSEAMAELLDRAQLNLDPNCAAYRKLGLAVLRADVRAWEAIEQRAKGEPIETPAIASHEPTLSISASLTPQGTKGMPTLKAAFEGWKKDGSRSSSTAAEYQRALSLFTELYGDIPVVEIKKAHALQFRQALQEVPRGKSKALAKLTLPELVEWHKGRPSVTSLTPAAVNKLLGGVQAIAQWAIKNGLVPEDTRDAFAGMKLPIVERGGGPFEPDELRRLFASPIFTEGERPQGCQGDTAFWLPLLALFTGCRRSELTGRKIADVSQIDGQWCLSIISTKDQKLKTAGSARTIPLHPELIRLGLLEFLKAPRGREGWLFPAVANAKAANTWSAWVGRWLDRMGLGGNRRGLHSLRHCFKDALRAAGVQEDLSDALTGHSNKSVGRSYGARARHPSQRHKVIVERYGMQRLMEAIGAVRYPGVDLQAIKWVGR